MKEKICFKCGILKPLSEFYSHPQMGDGHLTSAKNVLKKTHLKDTLKNQRMNLGWRENVQEDGKSSKDLVIKVDLKAQRKYV